METATFFIHGCVVKSWRDAAPWIGNWWKLINQARSEPDAVLVKIES